MEQYVHLKDLESDWLGINPNRNSGKFKTGSISLKIYKKKNRKMAYF